MHSETVAGDHRAGGFAYLPGSNFASGGVAALSGFAIERAVLAGPAPLQDGFAQVREHLDHLRRPLAALCGLELRMPRRLSGPEFTAFNRSHYLAQLDNWGLLCDGRSPLARTNVVPTASDQRVATLAAFSYTVPSTTAHRTFVTSGLAELPDDRKYPDAIIARGETGTAAFVNKSAWIVDALRERVARLGGVWNDWTTVHLYTPDEFGFLLQREVLAPAGIAAARGIVWFDYAPPVPELALEIDVRCVARETTLFDG